MIYFWTFNTKYKINAPEIYIEYYISMISISTADEEL